MNETDPAIFEEAYYQRLFEFEATHWWSIGLRKAMDGMLQPVLAGRRGMYALDLGCGTGFMLKHLQRYPLAAEPIGLDYSAYALHFCRRRGTGKLILGNASAPPLADNVADLIICLDTLQHLAPKGADQEMLQACTRLLQPGGWLFLRTNSARGQRTLVGADPNHYRRYDRKQLRIMVREVGLVPIRATYLNCLPGLWAALGACFDAASHEVPATGPRLTVQPKTSLVRHWLLSAVLQLEATWVGRLGRDLPFGHSLAVLAQKPLDQAA